jgi:hypothetical protein
MIQTVAHALDDLNDRAVFVGGATLLLYIPEVYWPQSRATEDVDVVMELLTPAQNWDNETLLRKLGFVNDTREGAPACRWIFRGLSVDIMSTDANAAGFTNRWYIEGVDHAVGIILKNIVIRIFTTPYFLASKIEAFKSRGNNDFVASSDMEDIVAILEVGKTDRMVSELATASLELRQYLKDEMVAFLNNSSFNDALSGAVFNRSRPEAAIQSVHEKLRLF